MTPHISQPIGFIVDPTVTTVYYVVMKPLFSLRDKIMMTVWGLGILIGAVVIFTVIARLAPYSLMVVGAALWYVWYVAECALNGGQTSGLYPFKYARDDFLNNFGSAESQLAHRMELSRNDENWAEMYPGKMHCIVTHICIPIAPIVIWWFFQ